MASPLSVNSSPHTIGARRVDWIMRQLLIALVLPISLYVLLFGFGVLVQISIGIVAALVFETAALVCRGQPVFKALRDGSAVVLAVLLCLALPPYAPWWVAVVGVGFAVLLAKHAFGGLGHNVFNPAMVGYLFLLLCFPATMNAWPDAGAANGFCGPWESLRIVFFSVSSAPDHISGATVLEHVRTQASLMRMTSEMTESPAFGFIAGARWEWLGFAYIGAGGYLLWRRVISWRLPLSYLAGLISVASVAYVADTELNHGALFHVFAGGALFAAFFVVTDPVTSATTPRGMLVFGFAAGVLTYVLRQFGDFPDGVAFAIVAMNACAPLIDRMTQPRIYGTSHRTDQAKQPPRR